jgi:hypothetical protein
MGIFDWARSAVDRIEALKDDLILSRDEEFTTSLQEADREFRDRETLSSEELRAELELDEHQRPVAH